MIAEKKLDTIKNVKETQKIRFLGGFGIYTCVFGNDCLQRKSNKIG